MRDMGKYRGKRKDNGEWVYGYYVALSSDLPCIQPIGDFQRLIEVIPETVCEHIRRKDKNGIKIFEDDKWRSPGGKTYFVNYGESRPYESGEVVGNIHNEIEE